MIALVLALVGVASLAVAALLLRTVGLGYRLGRLLAATPEVSLDDAIELAGRGEPRYVRISGRISSDEEFPDEHDRPLVYRRRRLEASHAGRWEVLSDEREAVPFGIELRSAFIAVDGAALGDGLVVITREAHGRASELPADLARGLEPATPVRMRVEQVSAVEHATAAGVPARSSDGQPILAPGLGRPLILTTLEVPAAMRVLARGHRRTVIAAALLLACGTALLAGAIVAAIAFA